MPRGRRKIRRPRNRWCLEKWFCNSCKKSFPSAKLWSEHFKKFHKKKKLLCEKCKLKFKLYPDVLRHMKDRHLHTAFVCSECNQAFYRKCDYTTHDCGDISNFDNYHTGFYFDVEKEKYYTQYYFNERYELIIGKTFVENLPDGEKIKEALDSLQPSFEDRWKYYCIN